MQIWVEGYNITGNSSEASLLGEIDAQTLKDACIQYATHNPEFAKHFDPQRMTYWGCSLFDNEKDARKSFG